MSTSIDSCRTASKRSGLSPAVAKSRDTWQFERDKARKQSHSSVKKALTPGERHVETPETSRGFVSGAVPIFLYSIISFDPRFKLALADQLLQYFGGEARQPAFLESQGDQCGLPEATTAWRALYGKPTRNSEIVERVEIPAVAQLLASQLTQETNRYSQHG